jgi:two-component system chemotaxis response regulator CheB
VERLGGRVIVQDPGEAGYDSMPRSAIAATGQPVVVPASALANQVARLAGESHGPALPSAAGPEEPDEELIAEIGGLLDGSLETNTRSRTYSGLTCPECGGPLYFSRAERADTYDCLVGHRWSPQSLVEEHSATVERALWLAIRSLEERGKLTARLAESASERGHALSARRFAKAAEEASRSAGILREAASGMSAEVTAEAGDEA